VQEIPDPSTEDEEGEQRKWIMKAARGKGSRQAFKVWVTEAWSSFVDLIKVRHEYIITITVVY
jgi:hydroxymethylglutaryl-CoA reductase (NADPH)